MKTYKNDLHQLTYHNNNFLWYKDNYRHYYIALSTTDNKPLQAFVRTTRKMLEEHYHAIINTPSKNQYV